jgi:hypothetical protein
MSKRELTFELPNLRKCITMKNSAKVIKEFTPSSIISSFTTMLHTLPCFSKMKFNPFKKGSWF